MRLLLGGLVALAVFALASASVSAGVFAFWRSFRARVAGLPAERRAFLLFALRILPTAAALAVTGALVVPVWLTHEPERTGERPGTALIALAALALGMIASGLVRGVLALRATHRLTAAWLPSAEALSLPGAPASAYRIRDSFPAVCVVGILRPRLFLADQVLAALTPDEIAAVLAHEAGHLAARDNLKGLLARFLSMDGLGWSGFGPRLEEGWREAAEEAADAAAAAGTPRGLDLASALVKVARLSRPAARLGWPVPALHGGAALDGRVRRLLARPLPEAREAAFVSVPVVPAAALAVLAFGLVLSPGGLRAVHGILELLVGALP